MSTTIETIQARRATYEQQLRSALAARDEAVAAALHLEGAIAAADDLLKALEPSHEPQPPLADPGADHGMIALDPVTTFPEMAAGVG